MLDQGGREQASAIGISDRLPAASAAFVNGVLAHSLDYDDTHLPSVLHPSASCDPGRARRGRARRCRRPAHDRGHRRRARDLRPAREWPATTTTVELAVLRARTTRHVDLRHAGWRRRRGRPVRPRRRWRRQRDGRSPRRWRPGIIEANRTGGTVKRMHCGWAAHAAVSAAQLARGGFTGPPTVLEGRFGFFMAWLHRSSTSIQSIVDGLGGEWSIPGIFFKPYPANHFTHAGIDAARALRERGLDIGADRVDRARRPGGDSAHHRRADRSQTHSRDRVQGSVQRPVHRRRGPARRRRAGGRTRRLHRRTRPRPHAARAHGSRRRRRGRALLGHLPAAVPGRCCGCGPTMAASWWRACSPLAAVRIVHSRSTSWLASSPTMPAGYFRPLWSDSCASAAPGWRRYRTWASCSTHCETSM